MQYVMGRDGKRWHHKSVLALVREFGSERDPRELIRERARELVVQAKELGWSGPPYNPYFLASLLKIKIHPANPEFLDDAFIFPARGQQLEIMFNPSRPDTRRNFSICHEIGHTFFPDCYEHVRMRSSSRNKFDPDTEVEQLCNIAASELLFPLESFLEKVQAYGITLKAIDPIRRSFEASREATIRRMVDTTDLPCAAVFLELKHKPSEMSLMRQRGFDFGIPPPEPKMRVSYSVPSSSFSVFIPSDKSVPDNSCVYEAIDTDSISKAVEQWEVRGFTKSRVEAMPLPPSDFDEPVPRAVALVVPF